MKNMKNFPIFHDFSRNNNSLVYFGTEFPNGKHIFELIVYGVIEYYKLSSLCINNEYFLIDLTGA